MCTFCYFVAFVKTLSIILNSRCVIVVWTFLYTCVCTKYTRRMTHQWSYKLSSFLLTKKSFTV